MKTNESFVAELVRLIPQLKFICDEHLADNDTLLPHVFMGDVTRFVVAEADRASSQGFLKRLFDQLEVELTNGSEQVKELIVVSFVENLAGETVAIERLKPIMGPHLTKQVEEIC